MQNKLILSLMTTFTLGAVFAHADTTIQAPPPTAVNVIDELDPQAADIQQTLQKLDKAYEAQTGLSAHIGGALDQVLDVQLTPDCNKALCKVYIDVNKSQQRARLYLDGQLQSTWLVSTGINVRNTPNFETHPDGRIYDHYSSIKFPGGDYNGLGNMPYAVFIQGGYAIHGTGRSNWPKLGTQASHGCVRLHPDNAYIYNRLVRQWGVKNVWVTVE